VYEIWDLILAAAAIYVGTLKLDSKDRIPALIALIVRVLLIGIHLTVLIIGWEDTGLRRRNLLPARSTPCWLSPCLGKARSGEWNEYFTLLRILILSSQIQHIKGVCCF